MSVGKEGKRKVRGLRMLVEAYYPESCVYFYKSR